MSGRHHQRSGWTYNPRPRGICRGCGQSRTVDTHGLIVTHRLPRPQRPGHPSPYRCPGSQESPTPDQLADLQPVIDAANTTAPAATPRPQRSDEEATMDGATD